MCRNLRPHLIRTKVHKFISESRRDTFHGFCTLCVSVKCIYVFLLFPEMLCFLALCQIICLFMYLYYFQKCYVFWHCARLFVYLCIYIISRNVMFSGTVPDYLFIYVFILFPEMLCFLALCQIICLFMYLYYSQNHFLNVCALCKTGFRITVSWHHRYDGHNCIVVASTQLFNIYAIILAKCLPFWCYGNGHTTWNGVSTLITDDNSALPMIVQIKFFIV